MSTPLEKHAAAASQTARDGLNKLTDELGNLTYNTGNSVKRGLELGVKTGQNIGRTLGDAAEKTGAVTEALVKPFVGGKKKKTRRAKKSLRLRLKKSRKPKTLRKKRRKH